MAAANEKVAIFDFDGTLADVVPLVREIYTQEAARRGWPELTDDAFADLRKGTLRQTLKWVGIRSWQLPGLLRSGRKRFYAIRESIKLFPGVKAMLQRLHDDGWKIYILSSNSPATIDFVLKQHGIEYIRILKRPQLFGKARSINQLVKVHGYDRSRVWMIGDEVRDVEAGRAAGVHSMAVVWGLQDESILKLAKPEYVAYKLGDIERHLNAKRKS